MNTYLTSQNWIGNKAPSMDERNVKRRLEKLHSDESCERAVAASRKCRNKKKRDRVLAKIKWRTQSPASKAGLESRVRFHLSRGRDAADIAIRERVPFSTIQAIIGSQKTVVAKVETK